MGTRQFPGWLSLDSIIQADKTGSLVKQVAPNRIHMPLPTIEQISAVFRGTWFEQGNKGRSQTRSSEADTFT